MPLSARLEEQVAGAGVDGLAAEDRAHSALVDALVAGFSPAGRSRRRLRAFVALALDFWTWRRLAGEGLSDVRAAALMVSAYEAVSR